MWNSLKGIIIQVGEDSYQYDNLPQNTIIFWLCVRLLCYHNLATLAGTNSIEHNKKRDDMRCAVKVNSWTPALNITFDDTPKKEAQLGVSIIWYDDETMVVIAEDNIPMLEQKVSTTFETMTCWIK